MAWTIDDVVHVLFRTALDPNVLYIVVAPLLFYDVGTPYLGLRRATKLLLAWLALVVFFRHLVPSLQEWIHYGLPPPSLSYLLSSSPPPFDWTSQTVLLTGSSGALGSALTSALLSRGARVVGVDLLPPCASTLVREGFEFHPVDVSSPEEIRALGEELEGRVTVLMSNAGLVNGRPLLDLTDEDIQKSINVNLVSHFTLLRTFLPPMLARQSGSIVSISSALALAGAPRLTDYCATKSGLVGLHESLSRELIHEYQTTSIRPLLVQPAFIASSPLFSSIALPTSTFFNFFAPKLTPERVAEVVVGRVEEGKGGVVRLPFFVNLIPLVQQLPLIRELALYLSGADSSMDSFNPRRRRRPPPPLSSSLPSSANVPSSNSIE